MADLYMRILVSAQDQASGVIKAIAGAGDSLGKSLGLLAAGGIVAVGLGLAYAVKSAGDFQSGITTLKTGAGELEGNLSLVGQGLLKMAVDTGTSTQALTAGLYMIESAGYHGAAGLTILQVAAEGAKVGNADLGKTAFVLTTILHDYGLNSSQAANAMNALTTTVQIGKMHMQDLTTSLGSVLPIASALGVSFPQVAAAIATMTNAGMTAHRAAMNLANVLRSLAAPSGVATKAMKEVGLSAQQVHDTLTKGGLTAALQLIEEHVGKKFPAGSVESVKALKDLMGGATGYNVALMLGGKNMKGYEAGVAAVAAAFKNGHGAVIGWSDVQRDFNFKMEQAHQAIQVLAISIGTALLPILSRVLTAVVPLITSFMQWVTTSGALDAAANALGNALTIVFNAISMLITVVATIITFFRNNQLAADILAAALIGIGTAIAVAVIPGLVAAGIAAVVAFGAWAVAAAAAAIATIAATWPLILLGVAVAAVVLVIILAVQHWGQIVAWLKGVWGSVAAWFTNLWHQIQAVFTSVISAIVAFVQPKFTALAAFFTTIWNGIKNFLTAVWNVIKAVAMVIFLLIAAAILAPFIPLIILIKSHWTQILAFLTSTWNTIRAVATAVWSAISAFFTMIWNAIKAVATAVWNAISAYISSQVHTTQATVTSVWSAVSSFLSGIWNAISGVASAVWNRISSVITGIVNALSGFLSGKWNAIRGAFASAMGALSGIASSAWGAVEGVIRGAINAIISLIDGMIGGVNAITGVVGLPSIPMIPHLASGGYISNTGLAMVHKGEQVVPAGAHPVAVTTGTGKGSGGMTVNNTFYVQQLTQQEMDRAVSYMADRLRAQMGNI